MNGLAAVNRTGRLIAAVALLLGVWLLIALAVAAPASAAYTFDNCASCHTTYPDAHSLDNCYACHDDYLGGEPHALAPGVPALRCLGCHDAGPGPYLHGTNLNGSSYAPQSPIAHYSTVPSYVSGQTYSCDGCHSATYPTVPRHDEATLEALHQSNIGGSSCEDCHNNSLADEAGHPACTTCHSSTAPLATQIAIATGDTRCIACHPNYEIAHDASHGPVVSAECVSCHGSSVSAIHADCSTCHTPTAPAGATCISCHPGFTEPHGAGVRTWGEADYYSWWMVGQEGSVLGEIGANPQNPGVHGNYLATTAKCGICHSVHRANANGVKLLNSADTSCAGCHVVGAGVTALEVNWSTGGGPHSTGTTGPNAGCNSRGCHVDNPHGANGSIYKIVAAKLLSRSADAWLTSKALSDPAASGITADDLNAVAGSTWDEGTRSAVRTGYTCNIEGCHYQTLLAVVSKGWSEDRKGPRYDLTDHRYVTGHLSVAAAVPGESSYVPVSSCVSCHDQTDSLTGNGFTTVSGYTFPHGQTPSAGSINNTGGARAYLWYTIAGDALGTDAGFFAAPNDKAFDGACLKCHRDGAGNGIGLNH